MQMPSRASQPAGSVGSGDFNGDGRDDILWRSDSGQLSDWLGTASGGFVTNDANAFNNVPTNWHVQSPDSLWV